MNSLLESIRRRKDLDNWERIQRNNEAIKIGELSTRGQIKIGFEKDIFLFSFNPTKKCADQILLVAEFMRGRKF